MALAPKTVPIHYWGCALTCSTPVSLCSTSLEPPDQLMAQKGRFCCFGPCLAALWHTQMALPDQRNGFNASPGMCPDLFHPCSTLFHQFGATRSAYGRKRPFLAALDALGALWHTHMALPDQRNGFNASPGICPALFTLVPLCSTSLEPPDPLMAQKGRF